MRSASSHRCTLRREYLIGIGRCDGSERFVPRCRRGLSSSRGVGRDGNRRVQFGKFLSFVLMRQTWLGVRQGFLLQFPGAIIIIGKWRDHHRGRKDGSRLQHLLIKWTYSPGPALRSDWYRTGCCPYASRDVCTNRDL